MHGLLENPNDVGLALLLAAPFLTDATISMRGAKRWFFGALLFLTVAGIASTQSRGAVLGLSAAYYLMMRARFKSRLLTGFGVAIAFAGLFMISGMADRETFVVSHDAYSGSSTVIDTSSRGRLDAWVAGTRMMLMNPLSGVGINQVSHNYGDYAVNPASWRNITSHNAFVQCAAATGLTGIIPFTILWLLSFLATLRLRDAVPEDSTPLERAFLRTQLPNLVATGIAAVFLSVAWFWFPYILFAQAATAARIYAPDRQPSAQELIPRGLGNIFRLAGTRRRVLPGRDSVVTDVDVVVVELPPAVSAHAE